MSLYIKGKDSIYLFLSTKIYNKPMSKRAYSYLYPFDLVYKVTNAYSFLTVNYLGWFSPLVLPTLRLTPRPYCQGHYPLNFLRPCFTYD